MRATYATTRSELVDMRQQSKNNVQKTRRSPPRCTSNFTTSNSSVNPSLSMVDVGSRSQVIEGTKPAKLGHFAVPLDRFSTGRELSVANGSKAELAPKGSMVWQPESLVESQYELWIESLGLGPIKNLAEDLRSGVILGLLLETVRPGFRLVGLNRRAVTKGAALGNVEKVLSALWATPGMRSKANMPSAAEVLEGQPMKVLRLCRELLRATVVRDVRDNLSSTLRWLNELLAPYGRSFRRAAASAPFGSGSALWQDLLDGVLFSCCLQRVWPAEVTDVVPDTSCLYWFPENNDELESNLEYAFALMAAVEIPVFWSVSDFVKKPNEEFVLLQLEALCQKLRECEHRLADLPQPILFRDHERLLQLEAERKQELLFRQNEFNTARAQLEAELAALTKQQNEMSVVALGREIQSQQNKELTQLKLDPNEATNERPQSPELELFHAHKDVFADIPCASVEIPAIDNEYFEALVPKPKSMLPLEVVLNSPELHLHVLASLDSDLSLWDADEERLARAAYTAFFTGAIPHVADTSTSRTVVPVTIAPRPGRSQAVAGPSGLIDTTVTGEEDDDFPLTDNPLFPILSDGELSPLTDPRSSSVAGLELGDELLAFMFTRHTFRVQRPKGLKDYVFVVKQRSKGYVLKYYKPSKQKHKGYILLNDISGVGAEIERCTVVLEANTKFKNAGGVSAFEIITASPSETRRLSCGLKALIPHIHSSSPPPLSPPPPAGPASP